MIKRLLMYGVGVIILILLLYPFLTWHFMDEKTLSISVMDKTVPKNDYREHLGLFWIFDHNKVFKNKKVMYDLEKDYYGYNPETYKGDPTFTITKGVDIIYVADTYGVYQADLQDNIFGERSNLLYGGLTIYEWNRIIDKKTSENTLIVEFNTLASPTQSLTRQVVEQNLGIDWSGWIGRYFPNLEDVEVPIWMKKNWEAQTGEEWNLVGEGITFVNERDKVIIIQDNDFEGKVNVIWTNEAVEMYPNVQNAEYAYWFDIIIPTKKVNVEAYYQLNLTEEAKDVLKKAGIPLNYPAILHNQSEKTYYFAGDYADINTNYYSKWNLPGWYYSINAFFNPNDEFFWKVYVPLMNYIIQEESSLGE